MLKPTRQRFAEIFKRERWARLADGLAILLAVSLPLSTSATSILVGLWLIAIVPTLNLPDLRRVLATPAGGLPVLFVLIGVLGMLWSFGIPMAERVDGAKSFYRFLFIPLLMVQFQRSEVAPWVLKGFIGSCVAALALSWAMLVFHFPMPWPRGGGVGIPVKDYIAQSGEFMVCMFVLAAIALKAWRDRRLWLTGGLLVLVALFLLNLMNVVTSRTALVVFPVLLVLFACQHLSRRGILVVLFAGLVFGASALSLSPNIRDSVSGMLSELHDFKPEGARTRAGERLEYWRKSIGFVAEAPLIGHGTGSIREQFRRSAEGQTGMAALASSNPHNQTFTVAIQLGLIGTAIMFAMWAAHVLLFVRGAGLAAWLGLVVVTQNIVGSLFNSHLFDFTQGWGYVLGVGIAGGVLLRNSVSQQTVAAPA